MARGPVNKRKKNFVLGGYRRFRSPNFYNDTRKISEKNRFNYSPLVLKILVLVIILIVALYFIFFSSAFRIKDVIVEGNNYVSTEMMTQYIPANQNIFLLKQKKVREQLINNHSEIEDIQIYRGIPNAIKVVVLEREGKIVWQTAGSKYLISSEGIAMKDIDDASAMNYPLVIDKTNIPVSLGSTIVSSSFIAFIRNLKNNFFDATNINSAYFEIPSTTFDVYLYTDAGFYIKFNTLRSSKKQLDNLKLILAQKRQDIHEYVDLRIDGWAYYK